MQGSPETSRAAIQIRWKRSWDARVGVRELRRVDEPVAKDLAPVDAQRLEGLDEETQRRGRRRDGRSVHAAPAYQSRAGAPAGRQIENWRPPSRVWHGGSSARPPSDRPYRRGPRAPAALGGLAGRPRLPLRWRDPLPLPGRRPSLPRRSTP